MATQSELINFVKSNYRINEQPSEFTLTLEFNSDDNRSQLIVISVSDAVAVIASPFCSVEDATPTQVFDAMDRASTFFGVKRVGSLYSLQHVAPIADLDASEIEFAFALVSGAADTLEKVLTGRDNW